MEMKPKKIQPDFSVGDKCILTKGVGFLSLKKFEKKIMTVKEVNYTANYEGQQCIKTELMHDSWWHKSHFRRVIL